MCGTTHIVAVRRQMDIGACHIIWSVTLFSLGKVIKFIFFVYVIIIAVVSTRYSLVKMCIFCPV